MEREVLQRLSIIERHLGLSSAPPPPLEDVSGLVAAYRDQIKVLTEDFQRERADRERMAGKLETMKMDYAERERRYWSRQNNLRHRSQPVSLPSSFSQLRAPKYECDDGNTLPKVFGQQMQQEQQQSQNEDEGIDEVF